MTPIATRHAGCSSQMRMQCEAGGYYGGTSRLLPMFGDALRGSVAGAESLGVGQHVLVPAFRGPATGDDLAQRGGDRTSKTAGHRSSSCFPAARSLGREAGTIHA